MSLLWIFTGVCLLLNGLNCIDKSIIFLMCISSVRRSRQLFPRLLYFPFSGNPSKNLTNLESCLVQYVKFILKKSSSNVNMSFFLRSLKKVHFWQSKQRKLHWIFFDFSMIALVNVHSNLSGISIENNYNNARFYAANRSNFRSEQFHLGNVK